ncbi:MAG: aspartate aminotransferase family protein [Planctomycetota bacterium]|nr:aspartate aminotransferase family protein [Planctomycetota bacterium]MDA1214586.1 aspartate aminotransferase family protein [Planctomycetota bacterium]
MSQNKTNDLIAAYAAKRPESLKWYARAQETLAGGVGHDLRHFVPVPLYITHGRGGRKWDVDGNEYIDFLMGNGSLILGHADDEITEAIREAAADGTHFGNDHPRHIEWAELVQKIVPSAERVRFVNSGTEATHLALRLARAFTGRTKILRFEGHFHGWHDGVIHGFQPPFDADGSLGVPAHIRGDHVTIPDGNLDLVDITLNKQSDIAAAILEPSGASWGRVPISTEFLQGLRNITRRHGVLLIFDEIVTGFRFAPGGAQQLHDVTPDLSCFAKILAGGLPGGAVVGIAEVMKLFDLTGDPHHDRHQRVTHQGTFNGSPLSAAAGIVALNRIASGQPIETANAVTVYLREQWDAVLEKHGIAGYVYGPSSTFHIYFETDVEQIKNASRRSDLHTTDAGRLKGMPGSLIQHYQRLLRHHGVDNMSSTGGVLSAAHTHEDIDEATVAFEKTVVALRDEGLIATIDG